MISKIYMFASFGNLKHTPKGGGQTAARRLAKAIDEMGIEVVRLNRHRFYFDNRLFDKLSMLFGVLFDSIWFLLQMAFRGRKNSAVLYMSYCGSILPFDAIITSEIKMLGYKSLFYYAGGGGKQLFENGTKLYQKLFSWTIRQYDDVMLEGKEGIPLVEKVGAKRVSYLPNFTEDGFAPNEYPCKKNDCYKFLYFGRIDATKNLLLIVDIFNALCNKYTDVSLQIVGSGNSQYEELLKKRIKVSPYEKKIKWLPRTSHDVLKGILREQHFFLFPSKEPREGHSNALNEAMSWGIVPIVSSNNYLPSIVGNPQLVALDYEVESYVNIISEIINDGSYERISKEMYDRVRNNFTQSVVEKLLENNLKKLA